MNLEVDNYYRIIRNDISGHEFPIGELVVFKEHCGVCNRFEYEDGSDYWYVHEDEVEYV